ncbi:MAG: DNA-directed RNA polymerase subunit N [Candidatus Geothermarchaeales archaeon]
MMVPIRCFSCGALVADKYYRFVKAVEEGEDPHEALDQLGLERYCCRRMIISHVEVIDLFLSAKAGRKPGRE